MRVSDKIIEYIQGITQTKLGDTCAIIDEVNGFYLLAVDDITLGDETIANAVLAYDFKKDNWYVFSLAVAPQVWGTKVDITTGKKEVFFGDENGKTYKFWSGNTDDGTAIVTKMRTKPLDNGYPEFFKEYREAYFFTKNGEGVDIQAILDDNDADRVAMGELQNLYTKWEGKLRGRLFAFELSDSGTGTPWVLEGLTITRPLTHGKTKT